ncbi:MAG TPA: hypothetical protein ENL27_00210 [Candidatus Parcubacteria bacterium]|nr:hypothetical protein [Candidatus Parcubacteria bacterium]
MTKEKAYIVAVDMGYGHQRTAFPLRNFSFKGRVINANNYQGMPREDRKIWESSRRLYEFISRFKRFPLVGGFIFSLFDKLQSIPSYYPKRDLSKPTFALKRIYAAIRKGWGRDFVEKLKKQKGNLPIITTFFVPAFMAEIFDYPGSIFCVVCDADISRSWVALNPKESRIKYFAPNEWVVNRLKLYGVKEENIFLTGYPLPIENIGGKEMNILKKDLTYRLLNLDPGGSCRKKYEPLIKEKIGSIPDKADHILTIMFSIGGAGAQMAIVNQYLKSLKEKIKNKKLRVILSAGIRQGVYDYFSKKIREYNIEDGAEILFEKEINKYFSAFNQKLRKTDILWTKPSELSFYSALGIPIIIAPPIGSQEDFNKKWLLRMKSGVLEENPKYASQWIFDSLNSGRFAEAAIQGFIKEEKIGVFNIQKII